MAHSVKYLSDYLQCVDPLINEILNYELRIRGIQAAQAPSVKKSQLARELMDEYNGIMPTFHFHLTPADDLRACAALIAQFDASLTNSARTQNTITHALANLLFLKTRVERLRPVSLEDQNHTRILLSNIENVITRAENLIVAGNSQPVADILDLTSNIPPLNRQFSANNSQHQNFPQNMRQPHQRMPAEAENVWNTENFETGFLDHMFSNINLNSTQNPAGENNQNFAQTFSQSNPHFLNNGNNPFISNHQHLNNTNWVPRSLRFTQPQATQHFRPNIPNQSSQLSQRDSPIRRDHKIYKWNIKFNGEEKNSNAIDFIQKVNAVAQSRGVGQMDLFESAIELFSGQALKWYFAIRGQVSSWAEISEKLISDFVDVDYYDNLLLIIQQRKQSQNESIVHFFTVFEDDCSRLPNALTSAEKINILKRNILQKYRSNVVLREYGTVSELKHELKLLEAAMQSDYQRNVQFSGQAYQRPNSDRNSHRSRYDNYRNSNSRSSSTHSNNSYRDSSRGERHSSYNRSPTPGHNERNRYASRENSADKNKRYNNNSHDRRFNNSNDRNKPSNFSRENSRDRSQSRENANKSKNSSRNLN